MELVLPTSVYEDARYNRIRRGYLILIASLINEYLIDSNINDHVDMIIAIERSCFDHSVEVAEYELLSADFKVPAFQQLYRTKVIRITKNLDVNSEVGDEYLASSLLDGNIDPSTVSKLDSKELSPRRTAKLIDNLESRMNQKATLKTSTLYRCRQCGHKETTIRSQQMRAADESETLVINCVFCGYKWFN